jgi:hypothetical protein
VTARLAKLHVGSAIPSAPFLRLPARADAARCKIAFQFRDRQAEAPGRLLTLRHRPLRKRLSLNFEKLSTRPSIRAALQTAALQQ